MSVVFILVFVAIIMAGAFLVAFIWSVKSGQYEDTYTPSVRILFDDLLVKEEKEEQEDDDDKAQNKVCSSHKISIVSRHSSKQHNDSE